MTYTPWDGIDAEVSKAVFNTTYWTTTMPDNIKARKKKRKGLLSPISKRAFSLPKTVESSGRLGSLDMHMVRRTGIKTPFNKPSVKTTTTATMPEQTLHVPGLKYGLLKGEPMKLKMGGYSKTETKRKRARPTALGWATGAAGLGAGGYAVHRQVQKSWVPKVAGAGTKARTNARFFEGAYKPVTSLTQPERNQLRNHIYASKKAREGLKGATIRRDGPGGKINRVTVQEGAFRGRYGVDNRAVAYAERAIKRKGHEFSMKRMDGTPPNMSYTSLHRHLRTRPQAIKAPGGTYTPYVKPEDRIRKSYVPGVGWRAATKLTARQKALVPGGHFKAQGMKPRDRTFQREMRGVAAEIRSLTPAQKRKELGGVRRDPYSFNQTAFTIRVGGAKRGQSYVNGSAPTRSTQKAIQAHEDQHAKVKRSSYRMHRQIGQNPVKLMREEARADYRSMGHYNGRGAVSGYSDVARARDKALKAPNRPAKGSGPQARVMREYGQDDWKRVTNQQSYEGYANRAFGNVGYNRVNNAKNRDRSVDAYRNLQNHMRDKGVPVQKSFQPWDGLRSEVSKMGPDQSELHIGGQSDQRRKKRLRKLPPDAIRRI